MGFLGVPWINGRACKGTGDKIRGFWGCYWRKSKGFDDFGA